MKPAMLPRRSTSSQLSLSNIQEDEYIPCPALKPSDQLEAPTTPHEPMEFLSRSWSLSSLEVTKAINNNHSLVVDQASGDRRIHYNGKDTVINDMVSNSKEVECNTLVGPPFSFASSTTAHIVSEMVSDKIMARSDISSFTSRRNSHSSGTLGFMGSGPLIDSPPFSTQPPDDLTTWLLLQQRIHPEMNNLDCSNKVSRSFRKGNSLRGISMKRWLIEMRETKKEALRVHNSQVHAAMSVAGVAAAVAAIAASTATASSDDNFGQNKTLSIAVASAAALVAAQCVELAESMGADHDHISSVISSAVNVKTPGDVTTLTAAAATALRGATALKARASRSSHSYATVIPYENGGASATNFSGELTSEGSEVEFCSQDFLKRGCEFLKRTRKGDLHWRLIFVYINKDGQVVVKSQSKCMRGAITKNKRRLVMGVITEIPSWPGRELLEGGDKKRYFGIKTDQGVMELECRNETEHRLWTEGIARLLSQARCQRMSK